MARKTPGKIFGELVKRYPPFYEKLNGFGGTFGTAARFASDKVQNGVAKGKIAGGEVGDLTPVAYMAHLTSGCCVVMHSGLIQLIAGCALSIVATDSGRFRGAKENEQTLSAAEVAERIASLFKTFEANNISFRQDFPTSLDQSGWATTMTVNAVIFLMMHELAHVHNEHTFGFWSSSWRKGDVFAQEIQADATAAQWLINYIQGTQDEGIQRQVFYAGAEFGLRIRMAMETKGIEFEKSHPKGGDRIEALRSQFKKSAGTRRFYEIANTSLAFDQMWRSIEKKLLDQPLGIGLTLDDILSTMRTFVQELLANEHSRNMITAQPVEGSPGVFQLMFNFDGERRQAIAKAAREYVWYAGPKLTSEAREHAEDVYEKGSIDFSLLLALLSLGDNAKEAK